MIFELQIGTADNFVRLAFVLKHQNRMYAIFADYCGFSDSRNFVQHDLYVLGKHL